MERRWRYPDRQRWNDVRVDITAGICARLSRPFPGPALRARSRIPKATCRRPVYRDGQPVESRDAVARRDRLIEHLASLAPVPGALDQIVQRFGTDIGRRGHRPFASYRAQGRSACCREPRRIGQSRRDRRLHGRREAHPRLLRRWRHGRSYHAELSARRLRVHYLLEPGWKADAAIQGLGRTNPNQAQPPLFRPSRPT